MCYSPTCDLLISPNIVSYPFFCMDRIPSLQWRNAPLCHLSNLPTWRHTPWVSVVNSAAVGQVLFDKINPYLLDADIIMGRLDQMPVFSLKQISMLFSIVPVLIYILINLIRRVLSASSPSLDTRCRLCNSHSNENGMIL